MFAIFVFFHCCHFVFEKKSTSTKKLNVVLRDSFEFLAIVWLWVNQG